MQPFRMAGTAPPDPRFAVEAIGYRMTIAAPVRVVAAPSWFCFIFHQPAIVLGSGGAQRTVAGSVQLLAPGDRVEHRADAERLERSWVRCSGTGVAAAVAEAGIRLGAVRQLAPPDGAIASLIALHRASAHPRGATSSLLLALFTALLHVAARDAGGDPSAGDGIAAARAHLESYFMLPQRLDDLARMAGCSRAQFCRRFRRAVGCSPCQYALRLRLESAHDLLLSGDRPIADIAEACGFADRFHLSRAFAARFGTGPAACRRAAAGRPPSP